MEALQKLRLLGRAAQYEPAEDVNPLGAASAPTHAPEELMGCVYHAATPKGHVRLLKTLLSSACERDCAYCPFRAGRDFRRAHFGPEELASLFVRLYRGNVVNGIFVSSAMVGGGPKTQDGILETAEILRKRYAFRGYLHLKIMPGAERDQVAAALTLADRVSVNLEAPNAQRLAHIAPRKGFDDELLQRLAWVEELRRARGGRGPSTTTQFVVGAAGESDAEILCTTEQLHRRMGLARAYFSSFRPIEDTPLEEQTPSPPMRERRLYEASFLLRDYGFCAEELPFDDEGNLPGHADPKLIWAERHLTEEPVEVNTADKEALLRVPGIGHKGAGRVLTARRQGRLADLSDLAKLGISTKRAAPYVLLDGKRPARQLKLWV
jgi:predicted DNA-binding helix-hairpin-helix protein